MIPNDLNEWTYEIVKELVDKKICESDRHDFKYGFPDPETLTKICCAYANTKGGFIVFGIKDKTDGYEVLGIENNKELAHEFGKKIDAEPTIEFSLPKIVTIPNSEKVLAIFYIPLSPERPHISVKKPEKRIFYKRTNKGNDFMTYEEIRMSFQSYTERREKLKLLYIELLSNIDLLQRMKITETGDQPSYSLITLDSTIIENLLTELYTILGSGKELIKILLAIRNTIKIINNKAKIFFSQVAMPMTNQAAIIIEHNKYINGRADFLLPLLNQALDILEKKFGLSNPFNSPE
jgi:hypothetical protein